MKALKNIAGVVWSHLKGMVSTLGGGLMSGYLKLSEVVLKLSKNFLVFSQVLNGTLKLEDIQEEYPKLYSILTKLQSPVKAIIDVVGKLKKQLGDIKNAIASSGIFGKLGKSVSNLAKTAFGALYSVIERIQEKVGNITKHFAGGKIGSTIGNVFVKIAEGITNFVNALSGGERVVGSFMSFLGGVAHNIISMFTPIVLIS